MKDFDVYLEIVRVLENSGMTEKHPFIRQACKHRWRVAQLLGDISVFNEIFQFDNTGLKFIDIIWFNST